MPPQTAVRTSRHSLESLSTWALIATLVVAIVIFIPSVAVPFVATKSFVLASGVLITLALFILARLSRGNVVLPPILLVGALWLPALAYLFSSLFSGVQIQGALWGTALEPDTLGFILIATLLGTLAALILRRVGQYRTFFKVSAWTLGFVAVVQILILIVGQFSPKTISPAFSILGSSANLSALLGLGIISILLTLRFLEVSSRTHKLLLSIGVLSLILLAVFNSSFVWILIALTSLGLFVEAVMKRSPQSGDTDLDDTALISESVGDTDLGSRSLVMPLVVLAISLFFLIGGALGTALSSSLHVNTLDVRPSWTSTFMVARDVYSSSPVFGSGPGTFGPEWLKARDASLNSTVFWNTDFSSGIGFIPTSFVTTGILGLIAWLGLLGLLLVFGLRMVIFKAPKDTFTRYVSVLSFVGMIYLFANAIFGLPNTVLLALAFVFAGLFASTMRYASGKNQWGVIFSRAPRIGFIIVFVLTLVLLASVVAAYSVVERYVAVVDLSKAGTEYSIGNLDAATQAAQNSIAFAPTVAAYQIQTAIAGRRMSQISSSSTIAVADAQKSFQEALSSGINAAITATQINPNNYQNWLSLGNLYAQAVPLKVSGAYKSASTAYGKAAALNPTSAQIPYVMAQLDLANKDTKSAEVNLKKAIALKQNYTTAIILLSQLEVRDGNLKGALASAEAAAYFTPNNPNILFQVGVLRAASKNLSGAAQSLTAAITANPKFANARYFLAAILAKQGDMTGALAQIQTISAMSADNAKSVKKQIASLKAGKDPFPANLLTISSNSVK